MHVDTKRLCHACQKHTDWLTCPVCGVDTETYEYVSPVTFALVLGVLVMLTWVALGTPLSTAWR